MKFIETMDGLVNMDHVSRVVYDEQLKATFLIHPDGTTTKDIVDWWDSEPLALMDFVTAPDGYRVAHLYFKDGPDESPYVGPVIGLYVSRLGDGGVRAVLEGDGTVSRLIVNTRQGYAIMLVTPGGVLSDGEGCHLFKDVHAACAELAVVRRPVDPNKKETAA